MKKTLGKVIGFAVCLGLLTGCGGKQTGNGTDSEKTVSVEDISTKIKEQIAQDLKDDGVEEEVLVDGELAYYLETNLTDSQEEDPAVGIWIEKMGLDPEKLASGKVIAAMMNVNADEIIVLEAKEEADVASLKEMLEKELDGQVQTWKQYLPDQYEKVEKNVIQTKGRYLIYITYSEPEKIEKIFNESVQ